MIKEDYVSFETAKLLKENGFDEYCTHVYNIETRRNLEADFYTSRYVYNSWLDKNEPRLMVAPTLQIAMKWLREVHKIGVFPSIYAFTVGKNGSVKHVYGTAIINLETYERMTNDLMPMPTYEEAAEAAIKYCLENLI